MNTNNKTWYLFRHGLATHSKTGYGDKIVTAAILPESIPVIQKMAKYLVRVVEGVNFVSPYPRCRQTAAIISEVTGAQFIVDERLAEYHQTTFGEFQNRLSSFFDFISTRKEKAVLICTHGAVIGGLTQLILRGKFTESDLNNYPECGELLVIDHKTIHSTDFNLASRSP